MLSFTFKKYPEDFVVEEIIEPSEGGAAHWLIKIEKTGVSTLQVIKQLARRLHIPEKLIGYAGLKDSQAVAIQHLTIPSKGIKPEDLTRNEWEGFRIMEIRHYPHKLRAGHLVGNRFSIVLRRVSDMNRLIERLKAVSKEGFPNFFDTQRFGDRGRNLEKGLRLIKGERVKASPYLLRLYISAVSAWFFNLYLEERAKAGFFEGIMEGDLIFEDGSWIPERFAKCTGIPIPTGPILGYRMPLPSGKSLEFERSLMQKHHIALESFKPFKSPGSRRPIRVFPENLRWSPLGEGSIRLEFSLPRGSYATILLKCLTGSVSPQQGPRL